MNLKSFLLMIFNKPQRDTLGSQSFPKRLQSKFIIFAVTHPSDFQLKRIYNKLLRIHDFNKLLNHSQVQHSISSRAFRDPNRLIDSKERWLFDRYIRNQLKSQLSTAFTALCRYAEEQILHDAFVQKSITKNIFTLVWFEDS